MEMEIDCDLLSPTYSLQVEKRIASYAYWNALGNILR